MRKTPLEPGLLNLFRLFLLIQLLLIYGNVAAHSARGMLAGCPWCAVAFGTGSLLLLLAYLSIPRLGRALGRAYLPIAIVATAFISLVAQDLLLNSSPTFTPGGSEESAWQLFLFLFVPLVLVGWQHDFGAVVLYCLFTAGLDVLFIHLSVPGYLQLHTTYHRLVFIRALSFLLVGYILTRIMAQMRRQQSALQNANQKLAHYAVTLEQLTLSRERNRLARELHDTLAHTLSGLAVQLEGIKSVWDKNPAYAYSMLEDSLSATRRGLGETRAAIQALRSTPVETLGLVLALQELGRSAAERGGFAFYCEAPQERPVLSDEVELCLYRVAQEALENVVKHARAGEVRMKLEMQYDCSVLTICDDGLGFDPGEIDREGHFGLRGMCERAELAGGALSIDSRPGLGATLRLEVPRHA